MARRLLACTRNAHLRKLCFRSSTQPLHVPHPPAVASCGTLCVQNTLTDPSSDTPIARRCRDLANVLAILGKSRGIQVYLYGEPGEKGREGAGEEASGVARTKGVQLYLTGGTMRAGKGNYAVNHMNTAFLLALSITLVQSGACSTDLLWYLPLQTAAP